MLTSRIRALVLGLLAVMLAGSIMAATASAAAGPFWYHRNNAEEEAKKLTTTENFQGKASKQVLNGEIGSGESKTAIELESAGAQIKGAITNGADRGQVKFIIFYQQPTIVKPILKGCTASIGEQDVVQLKGHLLWKWDGTHAQLVAENQVAAGQEWDGIISAIEPAHQTTEKYKLEKGTFVEIGFKGAGCGVLAGKFPVNGSEVIMPNKKINEFSKKISLRTQPPGQSIWFLQHFWDQTTWQGVEICLLFAGNPASITGQTELESQQQEIGVRET